MRVKYSVIPFVPALLAMMYLKLMSVFGLDSDGKFMGMNSMNITYAVIAVAVGLFIICVLMNLFDRKTAPAYPVKKNSAAGIFAILSGIAIIASTVLTAGIALMDRTGSENTLIPLICAVFSLPAGMAMMVISKVHFSGKSTLSSLSVLFLFPCLWGCAELVNEFLQATKASITTKDLTVLFCYIFLSLFLFSNSMIISRIRGRNPVKGVFIYGLPMVALTLTYGVYELVRQHREGGFNMVHTLNAVMMLLLGLYAISFILEIFSNTYTKDDLEIMDNLPAEEEEEFASEGYPTFVKGNENITGLTGPAIDTSDYITSSEEMSGAVSETTAEEEQYRETDDTIITSVPVSDKARPVEAEGYVLAKDKTQQQPRKDTPHVNPESTDGYIMGFDYEDSKKESLTPHEATAEEQREMEAVFYVDTQPSYKELKKRAKDKHKAEKKKDNNPKTLAESADADLENHSIDEILNANIKKNSRAAARGDEDVNREKLSEELRKAAGHHPAAKRPVAVSGNTVTSDVRKPEKPRGGKESRRAARNRKKAEEARRAEDARRAEEERRAEMVRKAEQVRRAEEARQAEEARRAEEERKAEEARRAEAARKAEEARRAEAARKAEEARRAEEARKAEEARRAEEAKRAEEARLAEEARKAEEARRAEEARKAAARANPSPENIGEREEIYREKRSAVDELLKQLGKKK